MNIDIVYYFCGRLFVLLQMNGLYFVNDNVYFRRDICFRFLWEKHSMSVAVIILFNEMVLSDYGGKLGSKKTFPQFSTASFFIRMPIEVSKTIVFKLFDSKYELCHRWVKRRGFTGYCNVTSTQKKFSQF